MKRYLNGFFLIKSTKINKKGGKMKLTAILVLLIALNLLLSLLAVYSGTIANWITLILVAIIGILLVTGKK